MKLAALIVPAALSLGAVQAYGQGAHNHGTPEPAPCCETATRAKAHEATGVVKKTDAAKGSVTLAHGPVKELNWPAMTMAFKVQDKALLDRLAVNSKVQFSFVQQGKDYVITAIR